MRLVPLAVALTLATAANPTAHAHGGNQRGPSDRTVKTLTGVCGLVADDMKRKGFDGTYVDETTWDTWWSFNKERFLARPKPALDADTRARVIARLRLLIDDPYADVTAPALIALARVESSTARPASPELVASIAKYVADPRCYATIPHGTSAMRPDVWQAAVLALGIASGDAAVAHLIDLAHDTESGRKLAATDGVGDPFRATAIYALGIAGSRTTDEALRRRVARTLVDVLTKRPSPHRTLTIAAVSALGIVPLAWSDAPDTTEPWMSREGQIRFLSSIHADSSLHYVARAHASGALANLLEGAPDSLRVQVAELLLPALDEDVREKDEVRMGCVLALGRIGDCDADAIDVRIRATIVGMAEHADHQSRNFTNLALAQIAARAGSGADADKGRAFVRDRLFQQLTSGKGHMRPHAAIGLAMFAISEPTSADANLAIDALRSALKDAVEPERIGAYAIALGIARDGGSAALLRSKLAEVSEPHARGFVAVALGMAGARDALDDLRKLVADSKYKPDLVTRAVIGLGLLADERDVLRLCELLGEAKGMSTVGAVATAIALTGDARAIDVLIAFTGRDDMTAKARGFAASALGMLADPEPLPWNECLSANVNYRAWSNVLSTRDGRGVLDFL